MPVASPQGLSTICGLSWGTADGRSPSHAPSIRSASSRLPLGTLTFERALIVDSGGIDP